MAVLPDPDRFDIWAKFMRALSAEGDKLDIGKADLREAFNATDAWIDDNAASFNAALPVAARTSLTAKQKVRLFVFVAERRFEVT